MIFIVLAFIIQLALMLYCFSNREYSNGYVEIAAILSVLLLGAFLFPEI